MFGERKRTYGNKKISSILHRKEILRTAPNSSTLFDALSVSNIKQYKKNIPSLFSANTKFTAAKKPIVKNKNIYSKGEAVVKPPEIKIHSYSSSDNSSDRSLHVKHNSINPFDQLKQSIKDSDCAFNKLLTGETNDVFQCLDPRINLSTDSSSYSPNKEETLNKPKTQKIKTNPVKKKKISYKMRKKCGLFSPSSNKEKSFDIINHELVVVNVNPSHSDTSIHLHALRDNENIKHFDSSNSYNSISFIEKYKNNNKSMSDSHDPPIISNSVLTPLTNEKVALISSTPYSKFSFLSRSHFNLSETLSLSHKSTEIESGNCDRQHMSKAMKENFPLEDLSNNPFTSIPRNNNRHNLSHDYLKSSKGKSHSKDTRPLTSLNYRCKETDHFFLNTESSDESDFLGFSNLNSVPASLPALSSRVKDNRGQCSPDIFNSSFEDVESGHEYKLLDKDDKINKNLTEGKTSIGQNLESETITKGSEGQLANVRNENLNPHDKEHSNSSWKGCSYKINAGHKYLNCPPKTTLYKKVLNNSIRYSCDNLDEVRNIFELPKYSLRKRNKLWKNKSSCKIKTASKINKLKNMPLADNTKKSNFHSLTEKDAISFDGKQSDDNSDCRSSGERVKVSLRKNRNTPVNNNKCNYDSSDSCFADRSNTSDEVKQGSIKSNIFNDIAKVSSPAMMHNMVAKPCTDSDNCSESIDAELQIENKLFENISFKTMSTVHSPTYDDNISRKFQLETVHTYVSQRKKKVYVDGSDCIWYGQEAFNLSENFKHVLNLKDSTIQHSINSTVVQNDLHKSQIEDVDTQVHENSFKSTTKGRRSVLLPGKRWERSLNIIKQLNSLNNVDQGLPNEYNPQLSVAKGRKYRQSVADLIKLQNKLDHSIIPHNMLTNYQDLPTTITRNVRRITIVQEPLLEAEVLNDSRASVNALSHNSQGLLSDACNDTEINLSSLKISEVDRSGVLLGKEHQEANWTGLNARDVVLRRCNQSHPLPFDECYPEKKLQKCCKIGEGVYGEVFLYKNEDDPTNPIVMKVIPIEGKELVNGDHQKKFEEIISEIVIAMELSGLRNNEENNTFGFNKIHGVRCVKGRYPERLVELWELYDELKGSENDCPVLFDANQLYVVLELANGGKDLEAFKFENAEQSYALFYQIALSLAAAEEALQFEHRDLHWGNVLINHTDELEVKYTLRGVMRTVPSCGVLASVIDFTLSRMTLPQAACTIYNNLAQDESLFSAVGDYQFEIYRLMQNKNGNIWQRFEPFTNILWLHYTLDKMISGLRYERTNTAVHKIYISKLQELKEKILKYNSCVDFVINEEY